MSTSKKTAPNKKSTPYPYITSFTHKGKRYYIKARSYEELIEKKTRKQIELQITRELRDDMSVRQWAIIAFESYKPNMSEQTRKDSMYRVNKHILSEIGHMPLKSVQPIHCQRVLNNQTGMSKSHVQKVYQELKFIFKKAYSNRLISEDPTMDLTVPSAKAGKRQALSAQEREAFLKVSENSRFLVFELMLYCGCRPREAMQAIGKDVFLEKGKPFLHIRGTKTENADRIVPMPPDFYAKIKNTGADMPIAPNEYGRPHSDSSYIRVVNRLKREMNLAMGCQTYRNALMPPYPLRESFVPYDLRHTYCTDLARRGVDMRTTQKLMGHANISVTADIYTNLDTNDIYRVAETLYEEKGGTDSR